MDYMIRNRCALKQEIESLKQTLSKQVKEKESLLQTFNVFKKESKEKENKNMDKEIELEKKIKELDNIVYKVGQSTQTVHMLMKPQVFYDDTHKQALGYQNPFYLKKTQWIKPTLYAGNLLFKKHDVISVVDEEETLILEEKSQLKMLAKQNDLILKEKKINISPINYPEPVITEAPSELPKMEAVVEQCSVDKKYFEIQKKEIFLDNDRLLEHIICQDVMNTVMHDDSINVNVLPANNICLVYDNLEIKKLEQENDHLFELLLSQDIVHICAELAKKEHMVEKNFFDEVVLRCSRLENRCVNLELKLQHQKESFLNKKYLNNQDAPEIQEFLNINEWQTKLNAKDVSIANLRKHIESVKGENVVENDLPQNKAQVIAPGIYKLDLELLSPNVLKNRDAHIDYIKHTRENADILRELVEHVRALRPLDSDLDSVCKNEEFD
ncbi:hypothetical protein Tco_0343924 [Tanacetum coccineum]